VLAGRKGVDGGELISTVVEGPTPHIKDGGSVVGTAGTRGRFRDCVFLADNDLRFLLEFMAVALSAGISSERGANCRRGEGRCG
jgi:hypothetical protein